MGGEESVGSGGGSSGGGVGGNSGAVQEGMVEMGGSHTWKVLVAAKHCWQKCSLDHVGGGSACGLGQWGVWVKMAGGKIL